MTAVEETRAGVLHEGAASLGALEVLTGCLLVETTLAWVEIASARGSVVRLTVDYACIRP